MALEVLFNDIAAAIHEKDGKMDGIAARDFPARIRAIPSDGGVKLESIVIATPPQKTGYIAGEAFDPAGMTVRAVYSNGQSLSIDPSALSFDPAGPLDEGTSAVTVSFQWGTEIASAVQPVSVMTAFIYGASWDGSPSTKWTRTDLAADFPACVPYVQGAAEYSSPFDGVMPWVGMVTQERAGGTMVAIPRFYYQLSHNADNEGLHIRISSAALDGFHVSPAHMDRGDGQGERDTVYIARYLFSHDYKSKTGAEAKTGVTLAEARTAIRSLGGGMQHWDYAMRFTIWLLYLVEMADWDSQRCIGVGDNRTSGHTDAMPYHTGTMSASRESYGNGAQYRNIEGLWDYIGTFLDGVYFNADAETCILLNPNDFLDTGKYDVKFKQESPRPSKFAIDTTAFPVFYPVESNAGSSNADYTCDTAFTGANQILQVGNRGGTSTRDRSGLFFNTIDHFTYTDSKIGARSMELPQTPEE